MAAHNLATWDRVLRTFAGIPLVVIGSFLGGYGGIALAAVGALLLVTAAAGWCALYRALGVSTKPLARQSP
jgi:hypothetical protein